MSENLSGRNLKGFRPKPLASPWFKPLPVPWSLTISTVESMLETGILTRILLQSLIQSFKNIMEYQLTPCMILIWMCLRLLGTLMKMFLCTPVESELEDLLMDLDYLQESHGLSALKSKNWWFLLWRIFPPTLLEHITHFSAWMKQCANNL